MADGVPGTITLGIALTLSDETGDKVAGTRPPSGTKGIVDPTRGVSVVVALGRAKSLLLVWNVQRW